MRTPKIRPAVARESVRARPAEGFRAARKSVLDVERGGTAEAGELALGFDPEEPQAPVALGRDPAARPKTRRSAPLAAPAGAVRQRRSRSSEPGSRRRARAARSRRPGRSARSRSPRNRSDRSKARAGNGRENPVPTSLAVDLHGPDRENHTRRGDHRRRARVPRLEHRALAGADVRRAQEGLHPVPAAQPRKIGPLFENAAQRREAERVGLVRRHAWGQRIDEEPDEGGLRVPFRREPARRPRVQELLGPAVAVARQKRSSARRASSRPPGRRPETSTTAFAAPAGVPQTAAIASVSSSDSRSSTSQ